MNKHPVVSLYIDARCTPEFQCMVLHEQVFFNESQYMTRLFITIHCTFQQNLLPSLIKMLDMPESYSTCSKKQCTLIGLLQILLKHVSMIQYNVSDLWPLAILACILGIKHNGLNSSTYLNKTRHKYYCI